MNVAVADSNVRISGSKHLMVNIFVFSDLVFNHPHPLREQGQKKKKLDMSPLQ